MAIKENKVLIIYYSRTGTTRRVAEAIHRELGGEMIEVLTLQYPPGIRGYLRAGLDAALGRAVPIKSKTPASSSYDLVLVGTPVWNSSASAPIRTYLAQSLPPAKHIAFFLTNGGSGAKRVFAQMEQLCGERPQATLAVSVGDVRRRVYGEKLRRFVQALHRPAEFSRAA